MPHLPVSVHSSSGAILCILHHTHWEAHDTFGCYPAAVCRPNQTNLFHLWMAMALVEMDDVCLMEHNRHLRVSTA